MSRYSSAKVPAVEAWGDSSDLLRRQNEALVRLLEFAGVDVPAHLAAANAVAVDAEARRFQVLKRLLEEDVLSEIDALPAGGD